MPSSNDAPHLPRPITLLINAHSRRGQALFQDAVNAVKTAGIPIAEAVSVKDKEEAQRLIAREIKAESNLIIIGGGDGTLSSCAGHLVGSSVAMGVLPLGTGNTLARSLGLPLDLEGAARTIAAGHVEGMDVGKVNGRVFLNSVSIGLSVEIAGSLDKETKERLGLLSWPVVGARVIATHRPLVLKVSSNEKVFTVRTHQLVISNGRYLAGPIAAAPDASVQDSCLRVFTLGGGNHKSLVQSALKLVTGRHVDDPSTHYFETKKVRIESVRRQAKADVDGEINERTPLELEVVPNALRVVVPRGFEAEAV